MTLSIFGYLIADAESSPGRAGAAGAPRLRDLILGLLSGDIPATSILGRLDPNLSDQVRAMVVHRGISVESFLANALMAFALDVADESWRQAIKYREAIADDAEAAAFTDLLTEVMRQRLEREISLAWPAESEPDMTLARRIG
jgi:hypothetical protein